MSKRIVTRKGPQEKPQTNHSPMPGLTLADITIAWKGCRCGKKASLTGADLLQLRELIKKGFAESWKALCHEMRAEWT